VSQDKDNSRRIGMSRREIGSEKKKGLSTGAKWGVGCGVGCLVVVVLLAAAGIFGFRVVKGKIDEVASELQTKGFENTVRGQSLEITDAITEPTLYMGQIVKIMSDCTTDLAIMAQIGEIHGRVEGKTYFRGQMLTVQPQAVLRKGLDVKAQTILQYGTVDGPITGTYQLLQDKTSGTQPGP